MVLRLQVSKLLERHGCTRVQRSVFFVDSFLPRELRKLKKALDKKLKTREVLPDDCILCIPVENDLLANTRWQGCPPCIENVGKRPRVLIF